MRLLLPSILVIVAIGLFVLYTNPMYQASKALQAQEISYDDALTKSQQLRAIRDQLLSRRNTFSAGDVQKLQEVLPDNVDNIRFIIDINNIAARHSVSLKDVQLGNLSNSNTQTSSVSTAATGPVGSVDIGFTITGTYDNMLAFLQDVEHSLRLINVEKLTFTASQNSVADYTFNVRTYWLH